MRRGYRIFVLWEHPHSWRDWLATLCPFKFYSFACFHSYWLLLCARHYYRNSLQSSEQDRFLMMVKGTPKKASSKDTFISRAQYCHFTLSVAFVEKEISLCLSRVLWRKQEVPLFIKSPKCFFNVGFHKDIKWHGLDLILVTHWLTWTTLGSLSGA